MGDDPIRGKCSAACFVDLATGESWSVYSCARCHWHTRSLEELTEHVRDAHGVAPFPTIEAFKGDVKT